LALSLGLTHLGGMVGLCIGILAGRSIQTVGYPLLVRGCLGKSPGLSMIWLMRPLIIMALLFAAATYLGSYVLIQSRLVWVAGVAVTLVLAFAVALGLGLPASLRAGVIDRLIHMTRRAGGSRT
ncbi:MAG: hypothetical protein ACR2HW_07050, partial [Gemmatimonadales bacterium]